MACRKIIVFWSIDEPLLSTFSNHILTFFLVLEMFCNDLFLCPHEPLNTLIISHEPFVPLSPVVKNHSCFMKLFASAKIIIDVIRYTVKCIDTRTTGIPLSKQRCNPGSAIGGRFLPQESMTTPLTSESVRHQITWNPFQHMLLLKYTLSKSSLIG